MAEFSGFWTTSGAPAGHQQASYTQAQWSTASAVMSACGAFEGVAPGYLNSLAGTVTGANTVAINTGGAMVDGKFYHNSASVNVNIPSAVGGGNTRIDRIVLRCSWAGFTVVITRIAGTDAGSPSAPAITQTSGTTYDIMLYQALVNTAGAVTLTDERVYAWVAAAGIATNAVTTAKILAANVTYAKLAPGASNVTSRQGNSATDWSVGGTTTYTPTTARIQVGVSSSTGVTIVTFPVAFAFPPVVTATPLHATSDLHVFLKAVTATTFTYDVHNQADADTACDVHWIAVGPE